MKNRDNLVKILTNIYTSHPECLAIYTTELVNNGRLTMFQVQKFLAGKQLDSCNEFILIWLYEPLVKYKFNVPPLSEFFTNEEILEAHSTILKNPQSKLPIKFKILSKLREDCYLTCQSVQQIMALKEGGLIRWKENMQRESIITKIDDESFVSHIKFDVNRAREIGKCMADGNFFPNALRWHIVTSDCDYEIVGSDEFILKSGYIAEIDGQHRNKGSEFALEDNPNLDLSMPIIISIGSPAVAQSIINQDEQRAPIEEHVVSSYRSTSGNDVVKLLIKNEDLDKSIRFCDTPQGVSAGSGFIIKSVMAEAIDKYYFKSEKVSKKTEEKTALWLADFFNELADILHNDFSNFRTVGKKNHTVNSEALTAYIYVSKFLLDMENWEKKLQKVIRKIDFETKLNVKYLDSILKEATEDV